MEYTSAAHGNFKFEFPRVTIVLGANGSGKSTLLRAIKDNFPSVYVEGGRTISISDAVLLTRHNFSEYQNYDQTLTRYKKKRKAKLVDRMFDAIMVLIQKEDAIKASHSDAVYKWEIGGKRGDMPKRDQPPLERLFEQYNEVFPHLHLSYAKGDGRLTVVNDKSLTSYGPSSLSDGEKQVFSLMADMLQLEDEYSVVVVDEPELNLHPELAERLWTLLECEYQDKRFVYATHSIQFALRAQVDALYVISSDPGKIRKISNLSEMQRSDLEKFLGGVPGILNAGSVVVTEGHEKSFDSIFYRWLLDDGKVEIFPCGNCEDVKQVIGKAGLWGQISTDIRLVGAIDSDFRSNAAHALISEGNLVQLDLHEAESYICSPEIVSAAARKIGSMPEIISEERIKNVIFDELQRQRLTIALKRSFYDSTFTVRMSLDRSVISSVGTKEEAMRHIQNKSTEEISKAVDAMSESVFERRLDSELAIIDGALRDKDVRTALKLLPGKELLGKLAPMAGCKNGTDLMRSIKRNLAVTDFAEVSALSQSIKRRIN
jgi:energy-coupling factor transporter ATP-binding protein EcfA2